MDYIRAVSGIGVGSSNRSQHSSRRYIPRTRAFHDSMYAAVWNLRGLLVQGNIIFSSAFPYAVHGCFCLETRSHGRTYKVLYIDGRLKFEITWHFLAMLSFVCFVSLAAS